MKKYNIQVCSPPSTSTKKYDCCKIPATNKKGKKICLLECKERPKCCPKPGQNLCVLKEECCNGKKVYQIVCKDSDCDDPCDDCCPDSCDESSSCDSCDSCDSDDGCCIQESFDSCCIKRCDSSDNCCESDDDSCDSSSFVIQACEKPCKSKPKCGSSGGKMIVVKATSCAAQDCCKPKKKKCATKPKATKKFKFVTC
ncbi:keratin-associated protein 10-9-like [Diaphorina citri]|uniref:Keratin-associated protein 10-9-like n=1 Tax=Diaphorina citri TaxID=121845 RepID=A0A1S3D1D6_DIACI|nr:keratin-associated protein 10-9-like [Diaphorina citri]